MSPSRNILIIEDDVPLRRLYRTALTLAGFDVREAGDGFAALQALEESRPDLVVLDLMLPILNGFAVYEDLKGQAGTRDIPVVIVSGIEGVEDYRLAADCVFRKPVAPDTLVEAVRRCLTPGTTLPS